MFLFFSQFLTKTKAAMGFNKSYVSSISQLFILDKQGFNKLFLECTLILIRFNPTKNRDPI